MKGKVQKMELIKIKNFCSTKDPIKVKGQTTNWEKNTYPTKD